MREWAGPFSAYRSEVREEWLDYNGHMHDASYGIAVSNANEEFFAELGLSADYREETGASFFTVESHLRYLAECSLGQVLTASTMLVDADAKRMRLHTELVSDGERTVATGEYLYLHVDTRRGATTALPADRQKVVSAVLEAHAGLPRPQHLGRGVGAARPGAVQS